MKLTRKIKNRALPSTDRIGFAKVSRYFLPFGYYKNRPNIRNPYHAVEIGRIEGFRFIVSPSV